MAQARVDHTETPSSSKPMLSTCAPMVGQRLEELRAKQDEFFETFQESRQDWFDRVQSETTLAYGFGVRLMEARSVPDAMAAWQEWGSRQLEMMADDGKHLLADAQKLIETGARFLCSGLPTNGGSRST